MKEKETEWLSSDSRIEPPPKIGRRKQKSARKLELLRWRALYKEEVKDLWDDDLLGVVAVLMLVFGTISFAVSVANVQSLEWMYGYLKVVMCVASPLVTCFAVYQFFNVCIHLFALISYPYPLPKLTFKQTFKFGNQSGSK